MENQVKTLVMPMTTPKPYATKQVFHLFFHRVEMLFRACPQPAKTPAVSPGETIELTWVFTWSIQKGPGFSPGVSPGEDQFSRVKKTQEFWIFGRPEFWVGWQHLVYTRGNTRFLPGLDIQTW